MTALTLQFVFCLPLHQTTGFLDSLLGWLGLLEIRMAKARGVLRGLLNALAASVLLGPQRGALLSACVERLVLATDSEVGYPYSVVDYVVRWLGRRFPGDRAVDQAAQAVLGETCPMCGGAVT